VYIVGKSGSGKSTTLFNLAMHDITAGEGAAVIDPTVTSPTPSLMPCRPSQPTRFVTSTLPIPSSRSDSTRWPASPPTGRALAAAGILSAFKHLWSDSWGPRLEHFLYNGMAALLTTPRQTYGPTPTTISAFVSYPAFKTRSSEGPGGRQPKAESNRTKSPEFRENSVQS
jgi:hypothetical protein